MGTLTINTTAPQDARLTAAFGTRLGLVDGNGDPRDATGSEIKDEVINLLRKIVRQQEQVAARVVADAGVADIVIAP